MGSDNAGILVAEAYPSVVGPVSHWNVGKAAEGAASFLFFFFCTPPAHFCKHVTKGLQREPSEELLCQFWRLISVIKVRSEGF